MTTDILYTRDKPLLKVINLCTAFSTPILLNVNIEIDHITRQSGRNGPKVAIVGPSGAGKTTLFRRLAGLEKPDSGQILVGLDQKPVRAGMVGVVPQNYLLFNHRTVESSLTLAASMREPDRQKAKAKVMVILETFGLADKRYREAYPLQLSGGQRQRVSIAEQMLSSNHFLIMDEPFSGLDIIVKQKVCQVIDQVSASDDLNTVILTTHDLESAVMIADTILLLGRDRDQHGNIIPGAHIVNVIDLIERGLAWHEDIEHRIGFAETVKELKEDFLTL